MYGYGASSGNGIKAFCSVMVFLVIVATIAGMLLAGSELFDRSRAQAEADRVKAETEALRAQTTYEESKRQLELQAEREQAAYAKQLREIALQKEAQKAAAEVQSHQRLQAIQAAFLKSVTNISLVVLPLAVAILVGVCSYYLITRAVTFREVQRAKLEEYTAKGLSPSFPEHVRHQDTPPPDQITLIQRSKIQEEQPTYDGLLAFGFDYVIPLQGTLLVPRDCVRLDPQRDYYPGGIRSEVAVAYLLALRRARIVSVEANGHLEWTCQRAVRTLEDIGIRISRQAFDKFLCCYLKSDLEEMERLLAQNEYQFADTAYSVEMEPVYAPA